MKNEDKGKRKYIGAVVVIALLAGIGLASAQPGITPGVFNTTDWISIVQNDPNSNALYVNDTFVHQGDAAVIVNFMNPTDLDGAYGVHAIGAHKTNRGANIGLGGQTSLDFDHQNGSAIGRLAYSAGYYDAGHFFGVIGSSIPNSLDNYGPQSTSSGVGGRFIAGPDDTHTLTLDTTGTYWVGGVYGKVEGAIDGTPTAGAVAGVIGIDNTTGTAPSYAGYFDGRVRVTDLPPGINTDEIVVADPDGVLRNSGKNMSALGADADWYNSSDPGNPPDDIDDSIYTHGKVGIGTSNPDKLLTVQGSVNNDYVARFQNTWPGAGQNNGVYIKAGSGSDRALRIEDTSGNTLLSVYGAGKVGIGTHSPVARLDIDPTVTGGGIVGTYYGVKNHATVGAGTQIINYYGAYIADPTISGGSITGNKSAIVTEADAGNVGIGTTSPARKLHVNDTMRLEPRSTAPSMPSEGDLYMNGSSHTLMLYDGTEWRNCCGPKKAKLK